MFCFALMAPKKSIFAANSVSSFTTGGWQGWVTKYVMSARSGSSPP
jgi:hypothetical protein